MTLLDDLPLGHRGGKMKINKSPIV